MNGYYSQVYPAGQPILGGNTLMPMYPAAYYHNYAHQSQTMGLPAHIFSPSAARPINAVPAIMSKPPPIAPNTGRHTLILYHVLYLPLQHAPPSLNSQMSF